MVAVLESPYKIKVRKARVPEPGNGEVRVKINGLGFDMVIPCLLEGGWNG